MIQLFQQYLSPHEKVQEPSSCLVQKKWLSQMVFIIHQNPEEVGTNTSEGINELASWSEGKQANNKRSLLPFCRLPPDATACI